MLSKADLGVAMALDQKPRPEKPSPFGCTLVAAREGGFFVRERAGQGYECETLFAGSLDECLAYLKGRFQ